MSNNSIDINKITNFISTHGSSNCYIGITTDISDRFLAHGLVDSQGKKADSRVAWYWGDAGTEQNARTIENQFLQKYKVRRIHPAPAPPRPGVP